MRKIILVSLVYFVGNSFLTCSQACVTVHAKQDKVANSIEKMETDKWVQYSLSNQSQEVFVYKFFRETGKTASFIINAVDPETLGRVIMKKLEDDNAFVSLQKAYEQQEKIAASSC